MNPKMTTTATLRLDDCILEILDGGRPATTVQLARWLGADRRGVEHRLASLHRRGAVEQHTFTRRTDGASLHLWRCPPDAAGG